MNTTERPPLESSPWNILEGRKPKPAYPDEYDAWKETADRCVAITAVGKQRASTFFVGDLMRVDEDGRALFFETLVFGGPFDKEEYQWHYATWEEAEAGHAAVVEMVQAATEPK